MPDFPEIKDVTAAVYVIPTDAPEADGTLAWTKTTMVMVTAEAGGEQGIGWTYAAAAATPVVTDVLAGAIAGRNAFDVPGANEAMNRAVRNIGRPGIAATAISAVDVALWDLKARLLGLPVADLLGRMHRSVPVYGSGGFTSYDEQQTREQLSGWVDSGIPRVKIKIGESWGGNELRDLSRVALAREVIGAGTELYVDANGAYRTGQAVRMGLEMAAEFGVTWYEEPVSSQDLAGLAIVRSKTTADVTAGEYSWTLADSARLIEAGAVDCLQLDVTRCGGVTEFLRGAALAAAHNLEVSAHCCPSLHAHVCAAVANLRHVEYFHDHQRIERLLFDGAAVPVGGALAADPEAPGFGLRLRVADAEQYRRG